MNKKHSTKPKRFCTTMFNYVSMNSRDSLRLPITGYTNVGSPYMEIDIPYSPLAESQQLGDYHELCPDMVSSSLPLQSFQFDSVT